MISHSAVIAEVAGLHAFLKQISYGSTITENDVVLSYLPLAHIFDRYSCRVCLAASRRHCITISLIRHLHFVLELTVT